MPPLRNRQVRHPLGFLNVRALPDRTAAIHRRGIRGRVQDLRVRPSQHWQRLHLDLRQPRFKGAGPVGGVAVRGGELDVGASVLGVDTQCCGHGGPLRLRPSILAHVGVSAQGHHASICDNLLHDSQGATGDNPGHLLSGPNRGDRSPRRQYVKSVFRMHVGCTR
jgi:hypothetical protein